MARGKLEDPEVAERLAGLEGWEREGDAIVRRWEASSFRHAQHAVNRMCDLAEGANHHPDLEWSFRRLTIRLTSHDVGGITRRDFRLAALVEDVLDGGA